MGINSKQVSRSQYMIQLKQHPQQQDPAERQASIHQKLCYTKFNHISLLLPSAFDWMMKEHITIKKKENLEENSWNRCRELLRPTIFKSNLWSLMSKSCS